MSGCGSARLCHKGEGTRIGRLKGRGRAVSRYLGMSADAWFANRRNARGRIKYFAAVCKNRVNDRAGSIVTRR